MGKLGALLVAALLIGGVIAAFNLMFGSPNQATCESTNRAIATDVAGRHAMNDFPLSRFDACERSDSGTVEISEISGPGLSGEERRSLCQRIANVALNGAIPVAGLKQVKVSSGEWYDTCEPFTAGG